MRRLFLTAAVLCGLALGACATEPPAAGLVIADVTVISPERDGPLEHAYVRIEDGRITEVSERPLRGATEIDGRGRYLIPGLIDSHVHLAVAPGFPAPMTAEQAAAHPGLVAAALAQDPRSFLFHGFTTVIDLVGTAERTARWNAQAIRPDAYFCGAVLHVEGRAHRVPFPRFSYGKSFNELLAPAEGPANAESVVAQIADEGAVCVKTLQDAYLPQTVEEGRALVAAAHARNLPVFIHANREAPQAYAVEIGADAIVHGMWRDHGEDPALGESARAVLAGVVRDRIGYQPTTQVIVGELDMIGTEFLARPDVADVYPPALIALYAGAEGAAATPDWVPGARADPQGNTRSHMRETIDARATEVTRILADDGALFLFGSDTPSDTLYTNPPGLNGRLEMNNWIAAGVTEAQLFRALTIDNARAVHLESEIGTVEAGKSANLLLLGANPLESVTAYDRIETIFLHGQPIARETLSARRAQN